jgi:hypothetical protein
MRRMIVQMIKMNLVMKRKMKKNKKEDNQVMQTNKQNSLLKNSMKMMIFQMGKGSVF